MIRTCVDECFESGFENWRRDVHINASLKGCRFGHVTPCLIWAFVYIFGTDVDTRLKFGMLIDISNAQKFTPKGASFRSHDPLFVARQHTDARY